MAQSYLVVITGLGGEPKYTAAFHKWATTIIDVAEDRFGLSRTNIVYLGEKVEANPELIAARSTRENVEKTLGELATRLRPNSQLFIMLIGHGSVRDGDALINLPGPDMSAADFAVLLEAFGSRTIIFVNAASASGDFIAALSRNGRVVVTATKSGRERYETQFGRYFVEAFVNDGADIDKNGLVSVLEAFGYASREVERYYESDNRLATEHPLLDDNGDGEGSPEPGPDAADGSLARTLFLVGDQPTADVTTVSDPRLAALYADKHQLEQRIDLLRAQKDSMEVEEYERQLEDLLIQLALKTREIRDLEGSTP